MNVLNNGIGETLGDVLATTKPLQLPGVVWYVNSAIGIDGGGLGKDRENPLATLAQATTNAADNDIICLQDGHTEVLTAVVTISKKLCIVGAGSSGGVPTVSFRTNSAGADTFVITGTNVELRNIWFKENVQLNSGGAATARVAVQASLFRATGCVFTSNANDATPALDLQAGASSARLVNCYFLSTATARNSKPGNGLNSSTGCSDLEMDGVILSDGTVGYIQPHFNGATLTRLKAQSISLLLGAKMVLNAASTGWINVATATGGGRVSW